MAGIISETGWFETPLGNYALKHESAFYDAAVADLFGFNAVQVGWNDIDLLQQSRIPHRFSVAPDAGRLRCNADQLPFAAHSLDLIILPHVLEFAEDPHQTLREAERVLVPEGHLILSGFNPLSLWGLRHMMKRQDDYPWRGRFMSLMRMKDWLALLGLEVVAGRMACYAPPFRSEKWLAKMHWLDNAGDRWWPMMGGVYFLVARKKVLGMRLIRPQWRARSFAQALVPRPRSTQKECQKNFTNPER